MKVLVIEDQAGIRDTLRDILELNGHEVLAAEDGVEGVKLAGESPDFIFCDVEMPNLDGHGVLAAVKQIPSVADVPFVFLTALAGRDRQREGMAAGADDYITKPFSERDILDAIAARTRRQRGVREQIQALTDQRQREINARWSHELLTPLNAVISSLDLLELDADTISREELKEMLSLIREGANRQERLAHKLIRYFGLQQALQRPRLGVLEGCPVEPAVAAGSLHAARLRKREGDLKIAAAPGRVTLAEEQLKHAVAEVVENAATFSPAGSPIVVSGVNRDGRYRITIVDAGPGLTAEQRADIGAFTQFDRKVQEQQGLGLGLAIARSTARLGGGDLTLGPGPGGRGLSAEFDLQLASG